MIYHWCTCLGRSTVFQRKQSFLQASSHSTVLETFEWGGAASGERGAQDVTHLHSVHRRVNVVRGGANHEWQLMCQLLFMIGLANSALFAGFRPMLSSEPEAVPSTAYRTVQYCTVLYSTVQYCTILYSTVQHCSVQYCAVQYCAVKYSIMLSSTVQHFTFLNSTQVN